MTIAKIDYLEHRRKVRVDYLNIDCRKKRAFAGMSCIENADVILKMPSVMAELAEGDFLVFSCLFQFRCFSENKYDLFSCARF